MRDSKPNLDRPCLNVCMWRGTWNSSLQTEGHMKVNGRDGQIVQAFVVD